MGPGRLPVVRRSVALPEELVQEAFEAAMAGMAADPAIRKECAAIASEFGCADLEGCIPPASA